MRKPVPALFKWGHFEPAVITCAVGWYLRFSLSYRNVEELLSERDFSADHTTVWRWVQCYAPELNKRCRRELRICRKLRNRISLFHSKLAVHGHLGQVDKSPESVMMP